MGLGTRYENYNEVLASDAEDIVLDNMDTLLDEIKDGSTSVYDFFVYDDKIHEAIDGYLSFQEAVDILEECREEETDSGLWEGQEPKDAIITMAFFSYRIDLTNEVMSYAQSKLEEELATQEYQYSELLSELQDLEERLERMNEQDEDDIDEELVETLEEDIEELTEKIDEIKDYINSIEEAIESI